MRDGGRTCRSWGCAWQVHDSCGRVWLGKKTPSRPRPSMYPAGEVAAHSSESGMTSDITRRFFVRLLPLPPPQPSVKYDGPAMVDHDLAHVRATQTDAVACPPWFFGTRCTQGIGLASPPLS